MELQAVMNILENFFGVAQYPDDVNVILGGFQCFPLHFDCGQCPVHLHQLGFQTLLPFQGV